MKQVNNPSGFAAVEAVLIVVILGIIGGTGYFVWHAKQNTDNALSNTAKSQPGISKGIKVTDYASCKAAPGSKLLQTDPAQCVTNKGQKFTQQNYLTVKEWAVNFPLDASTSSAVYSADQYSTGVTSATGGSAKLGLPSLGSDCGDSSSAPLGQYVEFTKSNVNEETNAATAEGVSLHELAKSAVEVPGSDGGYGGYYIAYVKPGVDCSNGENTAAVTAAEASFEAAIKHMKSGAL